MTQTSPYRLLERMAADGVLEAPEDGRTLERLAAEVRAMRKKMNVLPTARESEALPELQLLRELARGLLTPPFAELLAALDADERLERLLFEELFENVCSDVIRARIYTNKEIIRTADALFLALVVLCTRALGRARASPHQLALLNTIMDRGADYYKTNGKENSLFACPFGEPVETDEAVRRWVDGLEKDQAVDCVKAFAGKKNWSRAVVESMDSIIFKVRFLNDNQDCYLQNRYFEVAPAGSRETDFEWREGLRPGDLVDYFNFRSDWALYKVLRVSAEENVHGEAVKALELQKEARGEREAERAGGLNQSTFALGYDYGSHTVNVKAHSPAVAQPGKFSSRLGTQVDDSEDAFFLQGEKKERFAILRPNCSSGACSAYLVRYINAFGENGGFDHILAALDGSRPVSQEVMGQLVKIVQNTAENLVEPFVRRNGERMLAAMTTYVLDNAERNLRNMSQASLVSVIEGVASLAQRVHPPRQARGESQQLIIRLGVLCLKSEILEKQFFGAKQILALEAKSREFEGEVSRQHLAEILDREQVFERIVKGHPSLISKSSGVLKLLFSEQRIAESQLALLWEQICKTDSESRLALLALLKEILWEMSREHVRFLIRKMLENTDEISAETFELLTALRKTGWTKFADLEVVNLVNNVLWNVVQSDRELKPELFKEVMSSFVKNIEHENAREFVDQAAALFLAGRKPLRNLKLLGKIMKHTESLCLCVLEVVKRRRMVDALVGEIAALLRARPHGEALAPDEREQLAQRFKFFTKLTKIEGPDDAGAELFGFADFERIWEAAFEAASSEEFVHNWMKDFLMGERAETPSESFKAFFEANCLQLLEPGKSEFFKFLMIVFHKINLQEGGLAWRRVRVETLGLIVTKSSVKTVYTLVRPTEGLFGIDRFWELFLRSEHKALFAQLANYITKLYLPPELLLEESDSLYAEEKRKLTQRALELFADAAAPQNAAKAALLLARIVKHEERGRDNPLLSLASMKEGERLLLFVEREAKYPKERLKLQPFENQTLFELKKAIGREYRLTPERVVLLRENEQEIPAWDNSLTLEGVGVRARDLLLVREGETPEVVEAEVLDETGADFSAKAKRIFHEIFEDYSTDGHMMREDLARFISGATDGAWCAVSDERVSSLFDSYDAEGAGFLLEPSFVDFFRNAARAGESKLRTVRQNLHSLGYGRDLRLKRERVGVEAAVRASTRMQLAGNEEFNARLWQLTRLGYGEEADILRNLLELLTPACDKLRRLVEAPLAELVGDEQPRKEDFVVLGALLFRPAELHATLALLELPFGEPEFAALVGRVCEKAFVDALLAFVAKRLEQREHFSELCEQLFVALRLLERFLKIAVSYAQPDFPLEMKNLLTFCFKKPAKRSAPEVEGPKECPGAGEKDRSPRKDDKEKEKEDETGDEEEQLRRMRQALQGGEPLKSLTAQLDYGRLNELLVKILGRLNTSKGDAGKFQKGLLRTALVIFIASLKLDEAQLHQLLLVESFQQLIFAGLTHDKALFRLYYKNFYAILTANSHDLHTKIEFLRILISNITSQSSEAFYGLIELACSILGEIGELKAQSEGEGTALHFEFNFSQLFHDFSSKLLAHASSEASFDDKEDSLLIGYLAFMEKILRADDKVQKELEPTLKRTLVNHLFKECLFEVSVEGLAFNKIKCRSRKSRAAATGLLVQLVKGDLKATILLLITGLLPLAKQLPDLQNQASSSGDGERRNGLNFLGLRNLGSICYMLAMLQQFYCTPAFRFGILAADDGKALEMTEIKGRLIDDNLFHQFQRMFAYLEISERRDFLPVEFCLSYKDYSGQPINVLIQQDSDEFLKLIFEKVEEALKPTPYIGALDSVFLGKICNLITCKGCGYQKDNSEAFYNLSLEVKGMAGIAESFDKFVEEEIISDYMCDHCKKKCDISKRALLKTLPNVLIVYLKKMIFDMEIQMNIKIHARYEFAMRLNLRPYVHVPDPAGQDLEEDEQLGGRAEVPQAAVTDEDFEYKLVGVVIHKGNADHGHYTSLINVNRAEPKSPAEDGEDLWLEFDDYRVSRFDMSHFQEECFGSAEDREFPSNFMSAETNVSKSAYLLVYDKVRKSDLVLPLNPDRFEEDKQAVVSHLRDPAAFRLVGNALHTNFHNLKSQVPEIYRREIEKDNCALILEQQLLSGSFTNALAEIFANVDLGTVEGAGGEDVFAHRRSFAEAALQALPIFLFKIYCVATDNFKISRIVRTIESALSFLSFSKLVTPASGASVDSRILTFYVNNVAGYLKPMLNAITSANDNFLRMSLSDYLAAVFTIVAKHFAVALEPGQREDFGPHAPPEIAASYYLSRTLTALLAQVPSDEANPIQFRRVANIFQILQRLAEQNEPVRELFLRMSMLTSFYELYISIDCSKIAGLEKSFTHVLSLINVLLQQLKQTMQRPDENLASLTNYYQHFARVDFLAKVLKEDYRFNNFEALKALVATFAFDNRQISDQLVHVCLKGVMNTSELDSLGYLEAFRALLALPDGLTQHRLEAIFGVARLNEQAVSDDGQGELFLYGLGKESSLKKAVFGYVSSYGLERGLLELLFSSKDISESGTMLLMYYVLELAETMPPVLDYLARVAPPNYLTGAFYDWFKAYAEHHLKYLPTTYASYKPELTLLYFNSMPEKLEAFEKRLRAYAERGGRIVDERQRLFSSNGNIYGSYSSSFFNAEREGGSEEPLFLFGPSYIIGRTLRSELLSQIALDDDEFGEFKFKFHLSRVCLLESRPTGATNLALPQSCITYDSYVNKASITDPVLLGFLSARGGEADDKELTPIFEDDRGFDKKERRGEKTRQVQEEVEAEGRSAARSFSVRDAVMRISYSNKTGNSYVVRLKIAWEGEKRRTGQELELVFAVRSRKSNTLIHNLLLNGPEDSFDGLRVFASYKNVDIINLKSFVDEDFSEFVELFALPLDH